MPPRIIHRRPDSGFTLLEVLVALVLAGLVVSAAVGLPRLMSRFEGQSEQRAEARDGMTGVDRLLRAMVEAAVPDVSGRLGSVSGVEDALALLSLGPPILTLDRPVPMALRAERREDGVALLFGWVDPYGGESREEVVLEGARSVSFAYFGPPPAQDDGTEHPPVWLPRWDRAQSLPLAVYLRVDLPALGGPVELLARTRSRLPEACILLPAEGGCRAEAP